MRIRARSSAALIAGVAVAWAGGWWAQAAEFGASSTSEAVSVAAAPASGDSPRIDIVSGFCGYNGYVRFEVDTLVGGSTEGASITGTGQLRCNPGIADGYCNLVKGWPASTDSGGWWLLKVGGRIYKSGSASNYLTPPVPDRHSERGPGGGLDTLVFEWDNFAGLGIYVRIDERVVSLSNVPGENEQVLYRAVVKRIVPGCASIGFAHYWNVMTCSNDNGPIATSAGSYTLATALLGANVPDEWRGYQIAFPGNTGEMRSLGILRGYDIPEAPSAFWFGGWANSRNSGFADDGVDSGYPSSNGYATGVSYTDAAARVKWDLRSICQGDSSVFATYYGIGAASPGVVTVSHAPQVLHNDCNYVWPWQWPITMRLADLSTLALSSAHVSITPTTGPTPLSIIGTSPVAVPILTPNVGAADVTWHANAPATPGTYCYDIAYTYIPGEDFACTSGTLLPNGGGNFEANAGGFTGTGEWQRNVPQAGGDPSPHSGSWCWGTNPVGNYLNNDDVYLTSSAVALTGYTRYCMGFYQWYSIDAGGDGGRVQMSVDGGSSWTLVPSATYTTDSLGWNGASGGWLAEIYDITPYAGQTVKFRFHFHSDAATTSLGWFIDDFAVRGSSAAAPAETTITQSYCVTVPASSSNLVVDVTPSVSTGGCAGAPQGVQLVATPHGGTGPYVYSWSPATGLDATDIANPTANVNVPTTYTVTVTSFETCQGTATARYTLFPAPHVTLTATPPTRACSPDSVRLLASVSGGTGPFTYVWTPPTGLTSTSIANPIARGYIGSRTYHVTITGYHGCTDTGSVVATINAAPTLTTGDVSTSRGTPVQLNAAVATGTAPFVWSWAQSSQCPEPVTLYSYNFESDDGGFFPDGADFAWGTPTNLGNPGAHSGVNCWVTGLFGNYSDLADDYLYSPSWTIPLGYARCCASWYQWIRLEQCCDYHEVEYSLDGGTSWHPAIAPSYGTPPDSNWSLHSFDLTPFIGQSVTLRWHLHSNGSVNTLGLYLDDVVVSASAPVMLSCTNCSNPISTDTISQMYVVTLTDSGGCSVSVPVMVTVTTDTPANVSALGMGVAGAAEWHVTVDLLNNPMVESDTQWITATNTSAGPIDFGLSMAAPPGFTVDSIGGANRFNVLAYFNQSATPPLTSAYAYPRDAVGLAPVALYGTAARWGGGAYNVPSGAPNNARSIWLKLTPPRYFSASAFTVHLTLLGRVHVP